MIYATSKTEGLFEDNKELPQKPWHGDHNQRKAQPMQDRKMPKQQACQQKAKTSQG
ncbi:MAG: hypothetical protein ACRBCL_08265 [Maritimibacter sp.]